jgi:RHS repeat-associated protein
MVIRITYPQPSVWLDLWGGTSATFNGLDQFNRIIDQRWQNSITTTPTDIDRYQYGYDQDSNRIWKANVVGTPVVTGGLDEYYTYDTLNRLTEMQRGALNSTKTGITGTPRREMDYTLDPTGNWSTYLTKTSGTTDLNQGRASNRVNEITNITASGGTPAWVTPAYDAAGNTTTFPQQLDPTLAFTAVYDAWNRMLQVRDGSNIIAEYQYDGTSRRTTKLTYAGGVLTETRQFYYANAWREIEQRVGTSTSMDQQHVWGTRYIDELVCRDDATPLQLYATDDANFNITSLVATSGTVQGRFSYDPYGIAQEMTGGWLPTTDPYAWVDRFSGRPFDLETQIYCYRARHYLRQLGQFASRDPIGFHGSNLNLYEYCASNPIIFTDPTGLAAPKLPPELWNLIGHIKTHGLPGCNATDSCPVLYVKLAAWEAAYFARMVRNLYYTATGYINPHTQAETDTAGAIANCELFIKNHVPPCCPPPPVPPVGVPVTPPVVPVTPIPVPATPKVTVKDVVLAAPATMAVMTIIAAQKAQEAAAAAKKKLSEAADAASESLCRAGRSFKREFHHINDLFPLPLPYPWRKPARH